MKRLLITAAAIAAIAVPASLSAHRMWIVPSTTVVSGDDGWVTFDGAVSNDLFFPDHQPLRAQPSVTAPDGSTAQVENFTVGKYRATFDLHLAKQGTWKVAVINGGMNGSYMLNGEQKRLPRGTTADQIATAIPQGATDVKLTETAGRNEVFVTAGAPTTTVFKPTGTGLELVPVTHPNDLVANEPATFGFTVDGKPAPAGLSVTVVAGNGRYRDQPTADLTLTTDAKGQVTIKWPHAGMYWLNATATGKSTANPAAERRVSYTATLEVLGG